MKKIYTLVISLTILLLMVASASAATGGINNNIVYRQDNAYAHADVWTDSAAPVDTEVGEVTVMSNNGDAGIRLTYRDPATNSWWYTFDDTGMYQFYPLPKGSFVYGEDSAMVKAKQVPIKNTADLSQVQYIDVTLTWTKQPNGFVSSENGKPVYGMKFNTIYFDAVATGSDGVFSSVFGAHGVGPSNWNCLFTSSKGFVKE